MQRLRDRFRELYFGESRRAVRGRVVLLATGMAPVAVLPGPRGRIVVSGPQRSR